MSEPTADQVREQVMAEHPADTHDFAARRDAYRWRFNPDECRICGERIGHFGGSAERDPCKLIPQGVPLVEVRPNCYAVRRHRIGAAIRVACEARVKA